MGDWRGDWRDSAQMLPVTVHGIVPTMLATISDWFTAAPTMTVSALNRSASASVWAGTSVGAEGSSSPTHQAVSGSPGSVVEVQVVSMVSA